MRLLNELLKIHSQNTAPAAILLAIRARMEHKANISNRIGKMFPNGNRGVLFIGKAGTGKSSFMKRMFDGLNLGITNSEGNPIGKWIPSTGGSTGVGIYEVLEIYNDSIIFADELSLDTEKHVHVIKQIANGELVRPRHGNVEPIPFSGVLVGATNAIKLPKNNRELEHVLATLDRFIVVKTKTIARNPEEVMDTVLTDKESEQIDWNLIAEALVSSNNDDLNQNEKTLIKEVWNEKSREILDTTRAQWRNSQTVIDIFLFCKRFFSIKDLTKNDEILKFAQDMIDDCVLFNPVNILWLTPLEQTIYDFVRSKEVATTSQIISSVANAGLSVTRMTISRTMNRMQENHLIMRRSHGKYSCKQPGESYNLNDDSPKSAVNLANKL